MFSPRLSRSSSNQVLSSAFVACLLALSAASCVPIRAAEPVSFNDQIRPIFADRCFKCHGPDSQTRKAGLRLDQEQIAKGKLSDSGNVPIVPGHPERSELFTRLIARDDDERMPPADSKLALSKTEIELIRRWIAEGARWEKHWAFIPPGKSPLPRVENRRWPKKPIDFFLLARMEARGLHPTQPAERQHWLRRVTFDLTGLPPTLRELDAFLKDRSPGAEARVVDRLLDSPAFGERMAVEWLDVARYGDTDGLFEDHPRVIHPWRDWVVKAFNDNLPYDRFITWQLAGDLLPNATVQQRIATGFIRNNPTSNEGGLIDEDYRIKYLVDRVNTTATAFLGLTLECAQCHDHKYDPMTQREYYQFGGFFNSLVGKGNTKGATAPTLRVYSSAQTTRLAAISRQLGGLDEELKTTPPRLTADFETWLKRLEQPVKWDAPVLANNKRLRLDEQGWLVTPAPKTVPAPKTKSKTKSSPVGRGRYVRISFPTNHSGFLTISEVQVFSRGRNVARAGKARQSSVGYNAPAGKAIDGNHDGSFASCSCTNSEKSPWWEVDLGSDFPIDSVAVWNRTDCCPERLDNISIQILDSTRKPVARRDLKKASSRNTLPAGAAETKEKVETWTVSLALPAGQLAALRIESQKADLLEVVDVKLLSRDGKGKPQPVAINGAKKRQVSSKPVVLALKSPLTIGANKQLRLRLRSASPSGLRIRTTSDETSSLRATLPPQKAKRMQYYRARWPGFESARQRKKQLELERNKIEKETPLTMIAADIPKPRKNYLLIRGEYDKRGEVVATAAPGSIMPFAKSMPANRIGLAQWLTHRNNPLTARVAVNRYWQMIFGTGIVKTSEDFGTQGQRPSHQKLLDHLAVEFIETGWDVKALIRSLVLSAAYRQSSRRGLQDKFHDPDNRLLSRAPRRRLQAEFLRDHVLRVSGLLVARRGGTGVRPYQPAELFGANAIGSAGARFRLGSGADMYRRSLYTYWKRQIPAANMRLLGADGRTKCRTRRERTNTPLQALVLLNDPQFVEAARGLALRALQKGGDSIESRLSFAFRLATSRRPKANELALLKQEWQDRLREFRADSRLARQYLAGGGALKPPASIEVAELAAYAAVASLILNLDESFTTS